MIKLTPNNINRFSYYRIPVGLTICEYFLSEHNTNNIEIPPKRPSAKTFGEKTIKRVIISELIMTGKFGDNDDGKDYIVDTLNGDNKIIPHYFVCSKSVWNVLEEDRVPAMQNKSDISDTISITALTASGLVPWMYNINALRDAAKVTAYALCKYKLTTKDIRYLKRENAPHYIRDNWKNFMEQVKENYKKLNGRV